MKKGLIALALVGVMVFAFAATAMADHSPLYYFNFQAGNGVTQSEQFLEVFPAAWNTAAGTEIDNGSWFVPGVGKTANLHGGYLQSTAKCGVCHAVHRAPTAGTSAFATVGETGNGTDIIGRNATTGAGLTTGSATTSSRYAADAWTAEASTQMLLRSTAARACIYCHVVEAPSGKMYGGDSTLAIVGDTASGWGAFYGHTTGCTGCHAVHGANTFKSADGTVDDMILKYQGVKNLGTIPLVIQPNVYAGEPALYTSLDNAKTGVLSTAATSAGVTPLQAAVTAQCTICHAQYAVGEEVINSNYLNAELFQPASWSTANGSTAKIFVGNSTTPVSALPGNAGITYTAGSAGAPTGTMGSLIMSYKNHPLKAGGQAFKGAGASAFFTAGSVPVSATGSSVCQSCHNAPDVQDGAYAISSFPHYTPGYYKFMLAQDQSAFDTPDTLAEFTGGRQAFYSNGGKPAIMNDGYCIRCHTGVGTDY